MSDEGLRRPAVHREFGAAKIKPDARIAVVLGATWIVGLSVLFVTLAAVDLDNFRPISSDDVWIMSASYKLATQGIFGSDLYAGFFDAERYYFIALPIHHLLQAVSFRIGGAGVAQARWPSLVGALVLLWSVSWVAYRWYGAGVAVLTGLSMLLWRSKLIGTYVGLPLLDVSRSGRYDVGAVAWMWLSIVLLDRLLRGGQRGTALFLGVTVGLATLTQFFGAFVLPLIGIAWFHHRGRHTFTEARSYWIVAGFLLVVLPYAAYAAQHPIELQGQMQYLKAGRVDFDDPLFYVDNFRREGTRYASLVEPPARAIPGPGTFERPLSPWLLVLGIGPTLAYLAWRLWREKRRSDRLLLLSALVFAGALALFDQTKASLYAIVLLPLICIVLSVFCVAILTWSRESKAALFVRCIAAVLVGAVLVLVVWEGSYAAQIDRRQAREVSDYLDVGRKIDAHLVPNARLLGADRWWWALREHPYLAFNNLRTQWIVAQTETDVPAVTFGEQVARAGIDVILVSPDVLGDVERAPDAFRYQFRRFLDECGTRTGEVMDSTYRTIEIYSITPGCSGGADT